MTATKVTVYAEKKWRQEASTNSKMGYLNVELLGLSGKPHAALASITSTRDISKLRIQLKFLTGDYLTHHRLANDRKTNDPHCRICKAPCEDIKHVLTECRGTAETRHRIFPDLLNMVAMITPNNELLNPHTLTSTTLTQFILDCGSMNLNNSYRLSYAHPGTREIFRISRDWCFSIHKMRTKLLKQLKES